MKKIWNQSKTFGFFSFRATAGPQRRGKSLRINFWTTPEQLSKRPENGFLTPNMAKMTPQRAKFWPKILILEVIYQPFELKIRLKVGLLRPKIMPIQLLNIYKTTFKKYKKRLFWPWKWSKWPSQRAKFWPKILILEVRYRPFVLKIHLKVDLLRPKIMPK